MRVSLRLTNEASEKRGGGSVDEMGVDGESRRFSASHSLMAVERTAS